MAVPVQEYYLAIGRLVVQFEHAVERLRVLIMDIAGLSNTQQGRWAARVFLYRIGGSELGEVLRTSLSDLRIPVSAGELLQPSPEDRKIIQDVALRWRALCKKRNEALHNRWFVAMGDEGRSLALKWRRLGSGLRPETIQYSLEDFQALADEAEAIVALLQYLEGVFEEKVNAGRSFEHIFADVCEFDEHVRIPPGRDVTSPPS